MHAATHFILLLLVGRAAHDFWLGKNGLSDYRELSNAIERQIAGDNLVLKDRNNLILPGDRRSDLGPWRPSRSCHATILATSKQGETFYRIIPKDKKRSGVTEPDGVPYDDRSPWRL